jgi:putative FmdB family regulatory protein
VPSGGTELPTYEYACKSCGEHLEVVQSFKDEPLTTCPACGGPLRKVFGNIGISFKGSGFYKTDSRSSSTASKTASTSSSESKPAETGSSSTSAATSGSSAPSTSSGSGSSGTSDAKAS